MQKHTTLNTLSDFCLISEFHSQQQPLFFKLKGCSKAADLWQQGPIDSKDAIYFFIWQAIRCASKIHLWGTFPIMALKWRKMKSQNDRLRWDYFWCSITYRPITCFLGPFFLFTGRSFSFFILVTTQKTTARGNGMFYFLSWKPRIIKTKPAVWVHRPGQILAAKMNAAHFKSVKSKSILHCTSGHLGCEASALR